MAEKDSRVVNFAEARAAKVTKKSVFGPISSGIIKPKPQTDEKNK